MTSIRVTAQGRSYAFPAGAVVSIGRAPDCDVVLHSPAVAARHARLVPDGAAWYLTGEEAAGGIWVAGRPVRSLALTGPVTATLGDPHGTAEIRVEPLGGPQRAAAPGPAPVLVTRLGGRQRTFPAGTRVRVGRDPSLELVSVNPLVSRQCHGVITSDAGGATYADRSRRGTFLDGRRLRGPLRITESVVLRLGDPATGEELGITPPLSSSRLARNQRRRILGGRLRTAAVAAAAGLAAAGLAAGITISQRNPSPAGNPAAGALSGGLQPAVLRHAEAATVRLLVGTRSRFTGWGSGTVISPDGLILTNAHVAEPQAPGVAVAVGLPASRLGPDPPFLTVELTTGPSSPVIARYRARPVAVDGYLDLAVVRVYATAGGQPVSPGSLRLPYLTFGDVGALQLDQPVTVLGFPGVAGSDSITVTSGVVSTFVPDPLGHVADPRFELETTARVAHGNSGGAAIDNAGQLIGVPSLAVPGEGSDVSWRLRSVTEAAPLVTAARGHTAYHSTILVRPAGTGSVTRTGAGATARAACSGSRRVTAASSAVFGISYARFPPGLDIAMLIVLPDGTAVTTPGGGLPQATAAAGSGCLGYQLTAGQLGLPALPAGTYRVQLLAGPDLAPADAAAGLTVSASAAGP